MGHRGPDMVQKVFRSFRVVLGGHSAWLLALNSELRTISIDSQSPLRVAKPLPTAFLPIFGLGHDSLPPKDCTSF